MCDDPKECHTLSSDNGIVEAIEGDISPIHADRILVHQDTLVLDVKRNFFISEPDRKSLFKEEYGLSSIWATHRRGWYSKLKLSRCR